METYMPKIRIAPQDLLGLRKIITELTYMAIAMEQGKATPFGAEQIRKYVARLKDCEAQRVEALHKEPRRGGLVCIDGSAINPDRIDGIVSASKETSIDDGVSDSKEWTEIYCGGSSEAFIVDLPIEETLKRLTALGVDIESDTDLETKTEATAQ